MTTPPTRRDILGAMLSMSALGFLPVSKHYDIGPQASITSHVRPNFEPVRDLILQTIAHGRATAVAVAVAHGGSIVWEDGFGWADREGRIKATAHTPFTLASITKPFTATTLMTLAAEGKVSLDDSANKYLTNSRIQGASGNAHASTTVRLLGAHASGLPTMYESYGLHEGGLALTPDALIGNYGRLAYPPNTCYEYSNIAFAALAVIASNLTGMDFGTLMTQRVLNPLGLHDSFFDTNVARLPTGAVRYDPEDNPIPYYTTSTPASGELYASVHDLAQFALFNMRNRVQGRASILNDRWLNELHKPVFGGASGVATTFGWFTGRLKSGASVVFKSGGQPGVATVLFMIPSENLACMVLTNRSDGRELCFQVSNRVLASYLPVWQQPEETAESSQSPFVVTPAFGGRWRGVLENDGATMQVELNINSSDSATLAIGDKPAEKVTGMKFEGVAFTAVSEGSIDSTDTLRTRAKTLKIKLFPHEGKLVGRILATAGDPNVKNVMLPYVVTMKRPSAK